MRIAIFTDTYIPDINGVATSSKILYNELVKHGHHVTVVTTELPSDSNYQDDPDEDIIRLPGIEIKALYGYRISNVYNFKAMKELKTRRLDVIHIQTEFGVGIFGKAVAENLNIPIVYTYHTMYEDYTHYVNFMNSKSVDSLAKNIVSRLSKIYGDNCTKLIVPSQKTKEVLEKYGIKKDIHVIATGLELERFDPKNGNLQLQQQIIDEYHLKDKFVVTFLGRIAAEKSIDIIIRAMKIALQKSNKLVCMIVGGGPSLEEYKKMVEEFHLEDSIIFTGPKTAEFVPSYYQVSDIFVSASLSETQGLTFIEAMACGIPAVARYDENNLTDVIHDGINGFIFKTEQDLADLIIRLSNTDLTKYGNQAYQDAMKFSSKVFFEKVIDVYIEAIEQKHFLYEVSSIIKIGHEKNEVIFLFDDSQISVELSDQMIEKYQLEAGKVIDRDIFDILKDHSQVVKAYQKALKLLTVKDYTRQQMKKKLMDSDSFDDAQLDSTLALLEEKNLINDEAYTMSYLHRCTRLGIGVNKAIFNLKNYGVDTEIIDICLEEFNETDEEYNAALELIDAIFTKNASHSNHAIMSRIRDKLYRKGFSYETIERAMSDYDFVYNDEQEKDLLEKEVDKSYIKYSRKFSGKALKDKMIQVLLRKGFNYQHIKEAIEKKGDFIDD